MPAPGPPDRPLQYVDARDLAAWMLDAAERRVGGAFNIVSRCGHATMGALLEACNRSVDQGAERVWLSPETVQAAYAQGLTCRPVEETVADTWRWLQVAGQPEPRSDRPALGLSAQTAAALAEAADTMGQGPV